MTKIRIAFYLQNLNVGGAQRVMVNLVNGFADRNYDVYLVLVTAEGEFLSQVADEVTIVDLQARRTATSLPALAGFLRECQPAVVMSALTHTNIIELLALRVSRDSPVGVISEHAALDDRLSYSRSHTMEYIMLKLAQYLYPWADHIVANSKAVAQSMTKLLGLSPERVNVVANPVVTQDIIDHRNSDRSTATVVQESNPLIINVGRLVRAKDHQTLVRAFAQIRRQTNADLLILGEGPERENIEDLIGTLGLEDSVSLPGSIPDPFPYLRQADVFALSSLSEGFGNVLVEAMACGCPVVATDCSTGPREILDDGKYGRLVPVGDVDALADAILATLANPPDPDRLRERASAYTTSRIIEKYERMFSDSLDPDGPTSRQS